MSKFRVFLFMSLIVAAFALVACGGDSEEADEGAALQRISVVMNDMYFGDTNDNATNPPVWTIKTGGKVAINADNKGALEHNWAIVQAGASLPDTISDPAEVEDLIIFDIGSVLADDTEDARFDAPAPGEYTIICTIAGHYPDMQGKLVVEN